MSRIIYPSIKLFSSLNNMSTKYSKKLLSEDSYIDQATGYNVFTEVYHIKRNNCCGNICRHCPYGHYYCSSRTNLIKNTVYLKIKTRDHEINISQNVSLVYYDGDLLSYINYLWIKSMYPEDRIVLFTLFDIDSNIIFNRSEPFKYIMDHSLINDVDVLALPISSNIENAITEGLKNKNIPNIKRISIFHDVIYSQFQFYFKDLLCEYLNYSNVSNIDELMDIVLKSKASIKVTGIKDLNNRLIHVGEDYNSKFVKKLNINGIDPLGRSGEFDTFVHFKKNEPKLAW